MYGVTMTDDLDPYKPVACDIHSEYELAIMRRTSLRLAWYDRHGQRRIGRVMPLDLYCRMGIEYLMVQCHKGRRHEIRLDRIMSARRREPLVG